MMLPIMRLCRLDRKIDECGTVDGIRIGWRNQSIQRKYALVPLCPQQIAYDLTWD
jgi:hypothetical protein